MKLNFKFTRREKLAFIPLVGIYWVIRYDLHHFNMYQLFWCMMIGVLIGKIV